VRTADASAILINADVTLARLTLETAKMQKIRLEIDDLAVESFNTVGGEPKNGGTVRGHGTELGAEGDTDTNCFTEFDGCNSEYSDCATCMYGCAQPTDTCFASCTTNLMEICFCG
jgi:hypothetical protein